MKKGITPVVAIVLLLIIAVAVVGLAYGFITGFFGTLTGKAAIVSGAASCDNAGLSTVTITNVGSDAIDNPDITILRTNCQDSDGSCPTDPTLFVNLASPIEPGSAGTLTEAVADPGVTAPCGLDHTCFYDVTVGGVTFPTRADC